VVLPHPQTAGSGGRPCGGGPSAGPRGAGRPGRTKVTSRCLFRVLAAMQETTRRTLGVRRLVSRMANPGGQQRSVLSACGGSRGSPPRADMAQALHRRSEAEHTPGMIGRRAAKGGAARRERTVPPGTVQCDWGLEDHPKWLLPGWAGRVLRSPVRSHVRSPPGETPPGRSPHRHLTRRTVGSVSTVGQSRPAGQTGQPDWAGRAGRRTDRDGQRYDGRRGRPGGDGLA
jgi:hypothetical protein